MNVALPFRCFWPLLGALLLAPSVLRAQAPVAAADAEATYNQTIQQRAQKIITPLGLEPEAKAQRVRDLVAGHYRTLRDIQARREAALKAAAPGDEAAALKVKDDAAREVQLHHVTFLSRLAAELTPEQVVQIKDGLTYGVLPNTYRHYLELYPKLSEEQRIQLLAWLIEAREYAMDGNSSEEKHGWFGKYKGRINNFLSAAGFDAKEAEKAWNERAKSGESTKPNGE